jgi:hypothetical protein
MVKDLFERIQNNKGPLGKWASQAEGYFVSKIRRVGTKNAVWWKRYFELEFE